MPGAGSTLPEPLADKSLFRSDLLIVPNAVAILGSARLLVAIELQVEVVEEPSLRRLHGERYPAYRTTVGRFVPGVGLERATRRSSART